jgi:hypothetical protein
MKIESIMQTLGSVLIFLFIFSGCSPALPKEAYRAYYDAEPTENELATLDMGTAAQVIIDDMHLVSGREYRTVKLIAGIHKVKWASLFRISLLVEPTGIAGSGRISRINFEPGHTYKFFQDRTTGYGYKLYTWVEDMTTGKVVDGEKIP